MKIFKLYVAMTALIVDAVAIFVGLLVAYQLRTDGGTLFNWPFASYWHLALLVTPIWLILFATQGLYNVQGLPRGWNGLSRVLIGLIAGWGVALIALYFWRTPQAATLSRLLVVYGIVTTAVLTIIGRMLVDLLTSVLYRGGVGLTRTVVVDGQASNVFAEQLASWKNGRKVIGVFNSGEATEKLSALARTERIDEVIVDHQNLDESDVLTILNWAELHGASFGLVPSLLSVRSTKVETVTLASTPVLFFPRTPLEGWRRIFKRLMDLLVVTVLLVILSPIYLILVVLVKIASPGPVIFRQERVGQDGSPFYIHKFRSMYADADERFKKFGGWSGDEKTDPRVTPLGRMLRQTNLDELPQLWDVFIGRMSLVGPRPEQPKYVEQFAKKIPDYLKRHHIKTGLTGWAQVNGLRGDTSIEERVKYDLYYIEHWSVLFDIRIVLATAILVLKQAFGG